MTTLGDQSEYFAVEEIVVVDAVPKQQGPDDHQMTS